MIKVEMEDGSMTINLDNFFPCSQARFNKLFRIIRRYPWLNDVQTIAGQLEQNFTDRIQGLDGLRKQKRLEREMMALKKNLKMLQSLEM